MPMTGYVPTRLTTVVTGSSSATGFCFCRRPSGRVFRGRRSWPGPPPSWRHSASALRAGLPAVGVTCLSAARLRLLPSDSCRLAREADKGWQQHRDELLKRIEGPYNDLIAAGSLRKFERARVSANPVRKVPILDEGTAYEMAAIHFFRRTKCADLPCSIRLHAAGTAIRSGRVCRREPGPTRSACACTKPFRT